MVRNKMLIRGMHLPITCGSASDYAQGFLMNAPIVRRPVISARQFNRLTLHEA